MLHQRVDLEELRQLRAPLREPVEPLLGSRLLAQLFADDELGVEQLEDRLGADAVKNVAVSGR